MSPPNPSRESHHAWGSDDLGTRRPGQVCAGRGTAQRPGRRGHARPPSPLTRAGSGAWAYVGPWVGVGPGRCPRPPVAELCGNRARPPPPSGFPTGRRGPQRHARQIASSSDGSPPSGWCQRATARPRPCGSPSCRCSGTRGWCRGCRRSSAQRTRRAGAFPPPGASRPKTRRCGRARHGAGAVRDGSVRPCAQGRTPPTRRYVHLRPRAAVPEPPPRPPHPADTGGVVGSLGR